MEGLTIWNGILHFIWAVFSAYGCYGVYHLIQLISKDIRRYIRHLPPKRKPHVIVGVIVVGIWSVVRTINIIVTYFS